MADKKSPGQEPEPDVPRKAHGLDLSRRSFLKGAGGVAAASGVLSAAAEAEASQEDGAGTVSGATEITLRINGEDKKLVCEPRTTLLSALRDRAEPPITGAKPVCDMGSCGACSVIVDGKPSYACLLLAVQCVGQEIRTVEGFGTPDEMSDVQAAFCEKDGMMCGFCTPGFVVATHAALDRNPDASLEELRYELSGNLCRCGTYPHVFDAAQSAQAARAKGGK